MIRLPPFNPNDPKLLRALKQLCVFYLLVGLVGMGLWFQYGLGNFGSRDFLKFCSATRLAQEGQAALAYDSAQLTHASRLIDPDSYVAYHWPYPPTAFVLYAPLAWVPCNLAWLLYIVASTGFLLAVLRRILDTPLVRWVALASPAVAFNAWNGQNGALNAALMATALLCMNTRPLCSGLSFAALSCKPHLVPLLCIAQFFQSKKALLYSLLMAATLCGLTTLLFGISIWQIWRQSLPFADLTGGGADVMTILDRMGSLFASARLMGFGVSASWGLQLALTVSATVMVVRLWRRRDVAFDIKASALPIASLLVSPYVFYYDYVLILPALAFWMRHITTHGSRHGELHLMALVWALPVWLGVGTHLHMVPFPSLVLWGALYYLARRERKPVSKN